MYVKLLKELRLFTALPDGTIYYDFHVWKGCEIKLGRTLPNKKKVQRIGKRKVRKIRFRGNDHFVLIGEIQGAYKKLPD